MFKRFSEAVVETGLNGRHVLRMTGSTERGTGIELVPVKADLSTLLVELCGDSKLRRLVLEALLQADADHEAARREGEVVREQDDTVIKEWLDALDPDELYVAVHRMGLAGASRRYFFDSSFSYSEADAIWRRALRKLPHGVGPRTLDAILWRRSR
jgi:hypothetical protein